MMPNKNYRKGVRVERMFKKTLEDSGVEVYRTAGSHGTYDLIAVYKDSVSFIQMKAGETGISAKELKKIEEAYPHNRKLRASKLVCHAKKVKGKYEFKMMGVGGFANE